MTDTLTRARIEEALARANAAAEGPWGTRMRDGFSYKVEGPEEDSHPVAQRLVEPDAEFIAEARTDVPAMAVALLAVLDLHKPETVAVMAQSAPKDYEVWPSVDVPVCSQCLPLHVREAIEDEEADESDVRPFLHPCPTVRAITGPKAGGDGRG